MPTKNQAEDGENPFDDKLTDLVEALNDHGFDDVNIMRDWLEAAEIEHIMVTFGTELEGLPDSTAKRGGFEAGEPAAAVTIRSNFDEYGITVGYGTERGYEITEQYAVADSLEETIETATHWFENEA
ncbi:uncharacterized protein Nmag_0536 [Natrialba magadii ATCC 43099]|uniref:Uncharacterized protein n=1 Tax=Natrialba magadii (strain ATCC 43099 / DSM 3394 / CCM 3739 / CIP 104546 / IAM 13178 / JCM 8861 / NBRC 102185 / NCIMB 2190 / MS3) TaxID=547559 RepID=D3SYL2_NATMM|nr:hypothetical protein [Natrialba magadii]ADD04123.1 uncharacterized protein Nmag_0536 [Natrialba magadii ATCC 43099]ELY32908.1 hypothetical protein C500_03089 [Natrialba magadii ATCC 43099]